MVLAAQYESWSMGRSALERLRVRAFRTGNRTHQCFTPNDASMRERCALNFNSNPAEMAIFRCVSARMQSVFTVELNLSTERSAPSGDP
jgi:hypothetical protein